MPVSNHQGVTWITGRQVDSSELAMLDRWEKYHALDPTFQSTGCCEAIDLHCLLYVIFHDEEVGPGYASASVVPTFEHTFPLPPVLWL